jgi:MscS family membrane protein
MVLWRMKPYRTIATLLLGLAMTLGSGIHAQDETAQPPDAANKGQADQGPDDAFDRGTPRGSIIGYIRACESFDFQQAAQYLDLKNVPAEVLEIGGPELARQLHHVLSRAAWLDDYTVSAHPEGVKGDELPEHRDELVVITTAGGEVPIWMQRVARGDGQLIWKISNRSVAKVPELYDEFSYPAGVETIRGWFPRSASFLGFEAFKWFIVITLLLLSWPILHFFGVMLSLLFSSRISPAYPFVRKITTGPVVAILMLVLTGVIVAELGAGIKAQEVMEGKTLITIVVVWVSWSVINLFKIHQQQKLEARDRPGAARLMQPMSTFAKLIILLFGILFWLHNVGVNITTLMAGLGVGGLALALALQKPIEDMMGALSLFSQAPVRVGDLCRYGSITGIVEDIGLRSTRIRTLSNTLVHVPNARIGHVEIENFSAREMIRYAPILRLRYDSSPEQLRTAVDEARAMLEQHPRVREELLLVRLTELGKDAILIKINAFVNATTIPESLEIGEDLNFRIMEIVHSNGLQFALPARSIYFGESAGRPIS